MKTVSKQELVSKANRALSYVNQGLREATLTDASIYGADSFIVFCALTGSVVRFFSSVEELELWARQENILKVSETLLALPQEIDQRFTFTRQGDRYVARIDGVDIIRNENHAAMVAALINNQAALA